MVVEGRELTWFPEQSESEVDVVFLVGDILGLPRQVHDALAHHVKEQTCGVKERVRRCVAPSVRAAIGNSI